MALVMRGVVCNKIAKRNTSADDERRKIAIAEAFLGLVWRPARPAKDRRPIWHKSVSVIRAATSTEQAFARRIDVVAEQLRQQALDACPGSRPRVVVHLDAAMGSATIDVTVV